MLAQHARAELTGARTNPMAAAVIVRDTETAAAVMCDWLAGRMAGQPARWLAARAVDDASADQNCLAACSQLA